MTMEQRPVEKKMKSPISVWFIVCDELCERFNYYGLRTILVLYLTSILNYSDDDSTMIYHGFIFLSYFMPLFGAVLADSYWGKFKTIIRLSTVYVLGNLILTGASMANNFPLSSQRSLTIVGLTLIAIGTGGIKPCVATFGGDQFQLPEQQDQLARFFSRFITAIYVGALISTFFTPELRRGVQCFNRDTCFPLAFGVLSLLMISSLVVFILGRKMYVRKKPENHVIFKTFGCILYAVRKKITLSSSSSSSSAADKAHWIYRAGDKYSEVEVSDSKAALEVLYTFIAYPVFWALYEQQGSRWTLQATLMNGKIDGIDWHIKPDQMQSIHPLLALSLNLSFNSVLYPLLAKFGIRRPLQRLVFSNSMAVLAFLFAAVLQYKIVGESTTIPSTEGRFTVYNGFDCNVYVNSSLLDGGTIGPLDSASFAYAPVSDRHFVKIALNFDVSCNPLADTRDGLHANVTVSKGQSISYFLTPAVNEKAILRRINDHYDDLIKPKNGHPNLRIVIGDDVRRKNEGFALVIRGKNTLNSYDVSSFADGRFKEMALGKYNLTRGDRVISADVNLMPATIYTLVIRNNSAGDAESKLYATDRGNYLHILWQTPQYACMILADVIFIATTIEFTFTEAPPRIKSFVSSCYALTQSVGNLVVVIISALSFHQQVHEYLFFSGLMLADTFLLAYLSYDYKYKDFKQRIDDGNEGNDNVTTNQNELAVRPTKLDAM